MDISGIKVRGLTRREIKNLEAEGVVLQEVKGDNIEVLDRLIDMCCSTIEDKEDLTPGQTAGLWHKILKRTYIDSGLEKNSEGPQS